MPSFLHGVETTYVQKGASSVRVVKSAVILLVGTAPMGPVNTPTLVLSDKDAAQFGSALSGFTIPQALDGIIDQKSAFVVVVNVADPAKAGHKTSITAEARTFANNAITVAHPPIVSGLAVKNGATTYTLNTDYTVDNATGVITRTAASTIPATQAVTVDYTYLDVAKVVAADVIGTVDGTSGARSGLKAGEDVFGLFGVFPKIIIAPSFSTDEDVVAEMAILADKVRAIAPVEAPVGTTPSVAITGRGPSGTINFNTGNGRVIPLYEFLKVYDTATDSNVLEAPSARYAGVVARTDEELGYWVSPSNKQIAGVVGVERPLSFALNDPNCEANLLNAAGIVTVINGFGTGFRFWGNRTAAFPASSAPETFISVLRTRDIIAESLDLAALDLLDKPINQGFIDDVRERGNKLIRTLMGRGGLVGGKVTFDPAKNPVDQIADGQLVFDIEYMPPVPCEKLTFQHYLNINLLQALK